MRIVPNTKKTRLFVHTSIHLIDAIEPNDPFIFLVSFTDLHNNIFQCGCDAI